VGPGFETDFCASAADVADEQWANADAIVGQCPPQYIDKLRKCRIFVKYGVGYDDVDIERFGKLGIPVCNTPDYGTREVADHAIALMMTLSKSIAYHDSELRADLRGNWRPAHNPFGHRLSVCTFGVVGMGRIGTAAPGQGVRHGCGVLRSISAERLSVRYRREARRLAGRADGPV
jgi:lactate dehydrogenase-like 2-hydroxyacid dehydrogenase